MSEHEVHEIQLNGKQLVFMFMAATVVSVVIFLCGVMVGRGVRQPLTDPLAANAATLTDSAAPLETPNVPYTPPAEPAPVPEEEALTYGGLEGAVPVDEPLRPAATPRPASAEADKPASKPPAPVVEARPSAKPGVVPPPPDKPSPKPAVPPVADKLAPKPAASQALAPAAKPALARALADTAAAKAEPASSTKFPEPRGKGSVIQVQAFPTVAEAEAFATRLKAKGYPVFITVNDDTATRTPFRVRLGKYTKTSDVEAVSRRLIQEERIKPWLIP